MQSEVSRQRRNKYKSKASVKPFEFEVESIPNEANPPSLADSVRKYEQVVDLISTTPGASFAVNDPEIENSGWAFFDAEFKFGRVHRDTSAAHLPSANIVMFAGTTTHDNRVIKILMTGWVGHMLTETILSEPSIRSGSRTEHLYDLLFQLAEEEQRGSFLIPDEFRRLPRETSPGDNVPLDEVANWAYGMVAGTHQFSTQRLKGLGEILSVSKDTQGNIDLIILTPLYAEQSYVDKLLAPKPAKRPRHSLRRLFRIQRSTEGSRPACD
ncbi:hypothetical protein ACWFRB_02870 [Rhodococcus sp. NPDC055112]